MERTQQQIYNTALGLVQDIGMAEDIAQEVFVNAYQNILSFNEQSSLSTWLYRITVNKSLDHIRAGKRQKRAGIFSELFHRDTGEPIHELTDFVHPGVKLEQKENARYLFAAINSLSEHQKTVFVLAYIEELPQKKIAEIMNISVKAVESLLQRAKEKLRKKLGYYYDRRNLK